MPNLWLSSDTHINHGARTPELGGYNYERNILQYCPGRGFENTPEGLAAMNEKLFENIANVVEPGDMYMHLGDFALGPASLHAGFVKRIKDLGVTMSLIRGNHDPSRERCLANGWDNVDNDALLTFEGYNFWLAHVPPETSGPDRVEGRELKRPPYRESWSKDNIITLCGHVHDCWLQAIDGTINVGVDVHDLRPVSLDRLIAIHQGEP